MTPIVMLTEKRPAHLSMFAAEIVSTITGRGGRLWVENGRIRFWMPPNRAVSIAVVKAIKARHDELMALLDEENGTL